MKTRLTPRSDKNTPFRQWTGPLTEEIVLRPAEFGLGQLPNPQQPDATTESVCGYCATGCSLKVHLKDSEAFNLSADANYPVNLGMACPKGWESLAPLKATDRATTPLLRDASGKLNPITWEEAMLEMITRFKSIKQRHGGRALSWLSTGQIPSEEMAFLGALCKFGMGMIHGDGNTRQCMATAVAAYKESFGFDAPPYTYQDFEESDVLVFVGSNLCITHPIMWQRVMRNRRNPEIIVLDPRRTETAMAATKHLPLRPKSDLALLYCFARLLVENDWLDNDFIQAHTEGFSELKEFLLNGPYDLATVAELSGLDQGAIFEVARMIGSGKRVSLWWTMGVNQSYEGTRVAQAIINLALLTGNIGKPGTGANSITGQCNAMGSRLFSNSTNLLGGHKFTLAKDRSKIAGILGIEEDCIPQEDSWAYDEILEGVERGEIKGLWIIATNTAHSWINQNRWNKLREQLDFMVVQDMYHTSETAQMADLVLPAAGWGEKEGTFINSERRIGRTRKVSRAPGQALADFHIFQLVAHYWGCGELFNRWNSPEAVFKILTEVSKGQPCDISGIKDYAMIESEGGIQWPLPEGTEAFDTQRRLFADGQFFYPSGRAKLIFEAPRKLPEATDVEYPFTLLTGRGSSSQWHTQTRTGKSDVLRKLYPAKSYIEINPKDAERLGIESESKVVISSRRGEITASAHLTPITPVGSIFAPMHYREVNQLTHSSFDPQSRQPNYKACAVQVCKA
ncbi:molybdopterin oxidoreductase family protein [Cerasicoccus arenae]|uniref:Nitrate reductase catalytic subunit n=1 Tax=Cerasicoccus arenae TaxID=424488 RepID=A0A8J3DCL7_9BACT|nr:nitrate reductase [Cerasicoccus arenae]MBK1859720.1 nitrate reductase [Cerasicoccus arenae]GHC05969.1 nitrate reductase catalytic subunit [Cerasicoccus arenae]